MIGEHTANVIRWRAVPPLDQLEVLVVDCQATAASPHGHLLEIGWARVGATAAAARARLIALPHRERIPPDPEGLRLAQIEARLDELRAAEEAFLRTRRELAEHTDAISAREQLLAQRERELDEREDGWGGPDLHELESRLRRLDTQRQAAQAGSFSGGFRRLEQEGTRHPPSQ